MDQDFKRSIKNEIVPAMIEKFGYKNIMEVPKLEKIVINMGVGEAKENQKVLESAVRRLNFNSWSKTSSNKSKEISC